MSEAYDIPRLAGAPERNTTCPAGDASKSSKGQQDADEQSVARKYWVYDHYDLCVAPTWGQSDYWPFCLWAVHYMNFIYCCCRHLIQIDQPGITTIGGPGESLGWWSDRSTILQTWSQSAVHERMKARCSYIKQRMKAFFERHPLRPCIERQKAWDAETKVRATGTDRAFMWYGWECQWNEGAEREPTVDVQSRLWLPHGLEDPQAVINYARALPGQPVAPVGGGQVLNVGRLAPQFGKSSAPVRPTAGVSDVFNAARDITKVQCGAAQARESACGSASEKNVTPKDENVANERSRSPRRMGDRDVHEVLTQHGEEDFSNFPTSPIGGFMFGGSDQEVNQSASKNLSTEATAGAASSRMSTVSSAGSRASISMSQTMNFCPSCGGKLLQGLPTPQKFCVGCGNNLM